MEYFVIFPSFNCFNDISKSFSIFTLYLLNKCNDFFIISNIFVAPKIENITVEANLSFVFLFLGILKAKNSYSNNLFSYMVDIYI